VHFNDAFRYGKPQACTALLARNRIIGLLELLKQLGLVGGGNAGAGVTDRDVERAVVGFGLDGDFAGISELDGVADEIDQDLRIRLTDLPAEWSSQREMLGFPSH
jgi:hypothetical protein